MNKKLYHLVRASLFAGIMVLCALSSACGGNDDKSSAPPPAPPRASASVTRPSSSSQPSTSPTQLSLADEAGCGGHMNRDEIRLVPVNCTASGDVSTGPSENGPWHFEGKNKSDDGTMVIVQKSAVWIKAPYGANVDNSKPSDVEAEMKRTGCTFKENGKPCKTVTKVNK